MAGRDDEADESGEDHQRHHPRLQQRDVIADFGLGNPGAKLDGVVIDNRHDGLASLKARRTQSARRHFDHCTRGSTSNWWNGGGDDSVHSSVVAPAPHGLSAACCLRTKASITP